MGVVSLILAAIGFALFASASVPHARRFALRQDKRAMRRRKYAGGAALAAALVPAIQHWGWIFGPVAWSGLIMLAAGLVFIWLNLVRAR